MEIQRRIRDRTKATLTEAATTAPPTTRRRPPGSRLYLENGKITARDGIQLRQWHLNTFFRSLFFFVTLVVLASVFVVGLGWFATQLLLLVIGFSFQRGRGSCRAKERFSSVSSTTDRPPAPPIRARIVWKQIRIALNEMQSPENCPHSRYNHFIRKIC